MATLSNLFVYLCLGFGFVCLFQIIFILNVLRRLKLAYNLRPMLYISQVKNGLHNSIFDFFKKYLELLKFIMSLISKQFPVKKMTTTGRNKKLVGKSESPYFSDSPDSVLREKKIKLDLFSYTNSLRLNASFFMQDCIILAKALLGTVLVRKLPTGELLKGMIVETESYLGVIDKASHSYNGKKTNRNEAMFLKPGTAYVYSIYGMYYCFNISSLEEGSAVLIRAIEPLEGRDTMQKFRIKAQKSASEIKYKDLCNGPSKLCQAFKIEKDLLNKVDLCQSEDMWLESGAQINTDTVIACKRIGIDSYGEEWANKPLRFYIKGNVCVSRRCKVTEKVHEEKVSAPEH